ncbi:polycystic kidney disease protein 1-like 2 [Erpetoichthys calabaricus]|uniref:polycystic kidney disease protein 1-like 2 n=1 Tax=Erpetoichthys calabaricus TaxID=27687 RepID=UPI0022346493|nr:polycystic kidney disease protein 1-like 2 [Erpetoichthys calabaricus]
MDTTLFPLMFILGCLMGQTDAARDINNLPCPGFQKSFDGSCYELVSLQRTFHSAQSWCERGGGHLAFILNEETQQFLEKNLDSEKDWWIGLAPATQNLTQEPIVTEGPLSWLDGSDVSYANWEYQPTSNTACGYIQKNSGFHWTASNNCSQEINFICEFESGRSLACVNSNATLQCGSGKVIEIDDSFYGRKSLHYCQLPSQPPLPLQEECSWIDVAINVTGYCHGLQVCQAAADITSYGEPCPGLGSYLFVEYHCKEGLQLNLKEIAAVFENITVSIKWLLTPSSGNLTCVMIMGDGHTINLDYPTDGRSEGSVVHMYSRAGVFTVTVECTTSEWNVAAHQAVTVQEPATEFDTIMCYCGNVSGDSNNCRAINGKPLLVQVKMKKGTNITYTILSAASPLAKISVQQGIQAKNLTIDSASLKQIGLGFHPFTIVASNNVTTPPVTTQLQVLLVEEIQGLQASLVSQGSVTLGNEIQINVSISHGVPASLQFKFLSSNKTFFETAEMKKAQQPEVFLFTSRFAGIFEVTISASNGFSEVNLNIGSLTITPPSSLFGDLTNETLSASGNDSESKLMKAETDIEEKFKARSAGGTALKITANPPMPVVLGMSVALTETGVTDKKATFQWTCESPCWGQWQQCEKDNKMDKTSHTINIPAKCLPDPFVLGQLTLNVGGAHQQSAKQCLSVTVNNKVQITISCENNCNGNIQQNITLKAQCNPTCENYKWYYVGDYDQNIPSSCNLATQDKRKVTLLKGSSQTFKLTTAYQKMYGPSIVIRAIGIKGSDSGFTDHTVTVPKDTATTPAPPTPPFCSITPSTGTVFTLFTITCKDGTCTAPPCTYCFSDNQGSTLHCGSELVVNSLHLPLGNKQKNYELEVTVTAKNAAGQSSTRTTAVQVLNTNETSDPNKLKDLVSKEVAVLMNSGEAAVSAMADLFQSVSSVLNDQENQVDNQKNTRMQLREEMLVDLSSVIQNGSVQTVNDALKTAEALKGLTTRSDELTAYAQMETSSCLQNLSQSLLSLVVAENSTSDELVLVAEPIITATGSVLTASESSSVENQMLSSSLLINAIDNIQSVLLHGKLADEDPIVINTPTVSLSVNRLYSGSVSGQTINLNNETTARFTFPLINDPEILEEEAVNVKMTSFKVNPFAWAGENEISGALGGLSLTRDNGSIIPVKNLTEDIKIYLPRTNDVPVNETIIPLRSSNIIKVNITASNVSLVLKLHPTWMVPLELFLGFQYQPNETFYDAKHELPNKDDEYTWVLRPDDLSLQIGIYYLLIIPLWEVGPNTTNASISVTSIVASCKYWEEMSSNWSTEGCRVGPHTNSTVTECFCNHLTFFGTFFVMPNVVDVSRTAELFATFTNNPVVVCVVGALFLIYILIIIWARRKDIQDAIKVKITVLEDNDPLAQYRYMLTVFTGHRRGAATSSQVTATLIGTNGESDPHHLYDSEKPVFERGAVDMFLLTTPFSLGELQSIRLWHDNSGKLPSWYINKVMVHDLEKDQKWHFLCNSWLSVDIGDCVLDKVFPVATEMDLKQFSNLFFMKTARDFRDGHIWFSVLSRPPHSNFTRVQRVSCCFSLLLCTMLTSIIFWGVPKDPAEQKMDLGQIEFTWQQVIIGFESSILMFPINLLIVTIFRNIRPRGKKSVQPNLEVDKKQGKNGRVSPSEPPSPENIHKKLSPDSVIKDIRRIAHALSKATKHTIPQLERDFRRTTDINKLLSLVDEIIRQHNGVDREFYTQSQKKEPSLVLTLGAVNIQESSLIDSPEKTSQCRVDCNHFLYRQLQHVEKQLELLGPSKFGSPQSYVQAVQQVHSMKVLLETHFLSISPKSDRLCSSPIDNATAKKGCQKGLPWWFVFIGWFLVLATSGVSAFFTMLYGLHYGKEGSIKWIISMAMSFFESLFITQPLKVLGFAAFFALVLKKVDEEEEIGKNPLEETLATPIDADMILNKRRDSSCSVYHPPPPTDIEKMKSKMFKEQKVFALIREILAYMGFLWMLLLLAYGQRDPNAYFLTQHIRQSFTNGVPNTLAISDIFNWANTTLVGCLYGTYPGFITDGNSKLVGSARIRQVRVRNNTCPLVKSVQSLVPGCNSPYSWDTEDTNSYGPGWNDILSNTSQFTSFWKYQTQDILRGHPIWGSSALYRGGGYVADLGTDSQTAKSILQYLFDNTWLDLYTRAVFVEFTVYNANVNLFCIVTLMMETSAIGAFQFGSELHNVRLYQSPGGLHIFVMASEAIYFLFILYYMVIQGKLMKEQKWLYFKSKWNLLELVIIILSWSALSVFIKRTLLGNRDVDYYQSHKDQFASFYDTAAADSVLGYIIAFLVLLATVKLWHLLRLNPKLHMITSTLRRAWTDISGFITVIVIMFLSYSIASNLLFGWTLYSYRTLMEASLTMVSLQLGSFNYEEVLDYNPVLGAFLIGSCIVFMTFVVLNLFISVILVAFSEEQQQHQPSEEEEIVDLMLIKLCSVFGLKYKKEENTAKQMEQDTVQS